MLKVAVVGLGDISHVHIHAIQNSTKAQLVAVFDENEKLSQQVPHVNYYNDLQTMIDSETLDCVHICLPHYLHVSATTTCVENGINVLKDALTSIAMIDAIQKSSESLKTVQFDSI